MDLTKCPDPIPIPNPNPKQISPTSDTNLAVGLMRLYSSLLEEFKSDEWVQATDAPTKDLLVDSLFMEALVWTVGGSTTADGRLRFDAFLRELCSGKTPDGYDSPSGRATVGFELPSQGEPGPSEHTVSAAIAQSSLNSERAGQRATLSPQRARTNKPVGLGWCGECCLKAERASERGVVE